MMSTIEDCPTCPKPLYEPGIDVTPTYYRVRQMSPGLFSTCRTITIGKAVDAIKAIYCKRKTTGKWATQSLLFLKTKWTTSRVRKWIKDHGFVVSGENFETLKQARNWLNYYLRAVDDKKENPRMQAWFYTLKEKNRGR